MDPFGIILKSFPFRLRDTHTHTCVQNFVFTQFMQNWLTSIDGYTLQSSYIDKQDMEETSWFLSHIHTHTHTSTGSHTYIHWIFVHLKMAQNICNGNKFNLSAFMWKIHFILLQYNWAWVPMLMATATMMMTMVLVSMVMLVVKPVWGTVEAIRKYDNNSIVIVLIL